jgi:hypothetical protein
MTENYPSAVTAEAPIATNTPAPAAVAKDQAAAVGHGAADAGQQVASVAKDQVQNVASEASSQARDLLNQTRSELTEQANGQQQRVASGLHAVGDELRSMTQHGGQSGIATDLAQQAAEKSHDLASWLESREPGHLVEELKSFARQRPSAFLALAAGAGLLAGRLTRGVKDAGSDSDANASTGPAPSEIEGAGPSESSLAAPPARAASTQGAHADIDDLASEYPLMGQGV